MLRAGETPSPRFWLASGAGLVAVLIFVVVSGAVRGGLGAADAFFLVGVGLCALGYAEGGALARELGGAQTICWALVVALPVTAPAAAIAVERNATPVPAASWLGSGYVAAVSMFLAFIAWYAGLARGGIAQVSQVQLAQPVLTIAWSALLLRESVGPLALVAAFAVMACVFAIQRTR